MPVYTLTGHIQHFAHLTLARALWGIRNGNVTRATRSLHTGFHCMPPDDIHPSLLASALQELSGESVTEELPATQDHHDFLGPAYKCRSHSAPRCAFRYVIHPHPLRGHE